MDGGRRLAQPLTWIARLRVRLLLSGQGNRVFAGAVASDSILLRSNMQRRMRRLWLSILRIRLPRGAGIAAVVLVIGASIVYGAIKGDHAPAIVAAIEDTRDQAANAAGFAITSLALSGNAHVGREDILARAGVTGRTSLVFLDVETVRDRLMTNPWIADAAVRKLYPGELQIHITERAAFALWQKDGRLSVIADDGTVLEPYLTPGRGRLPLVVGQGAEKRAKAFLDLIDRNPEIRDQMRAAILVGDRRWNLRLHNGLDVRLPETEVARALERLVALDHEVNLLSRDIAVVDLRLPDRVTVRLSPAAAQARADALKDKKPPGKKGGPA